MENTIKYDKVINIPKCFQPNDTFRKEFVALVKDGDIVGFVKIGV